MDPIPNDNIN